MIAKTQHKTHARTVNICIIFPSKVKNVIFWKLAVFKGKVLTSVKYE